jgi:hypothetical protein
MLIEALTCRLAPGVDEAAFLAADRRVQTEFIPNHPGFVRRTTARGADGEWMVLTFWGTAETADASRRLGETDPVATAFSVLLDDVAVARFETLD